MPDGEVLQEVGPVDVDSAGELVRRVGVHNQAKRLIKAVAQNFPPELVAAGSRRVLGGQSQTLDLAEVGDAASDAFGDDFVELLGAKVRGSEARPETIAVNVVFLTKSGRTARGIIPYDGLRKSQKAYAKGVQDGTVVIRDDDPEANRKALEEAQRRIVDLEAGDGGSTEPSGPAEPFDGYGDLKAAELVEKIEDGDYSLSTLVAIRNFEEAGGNPRETVVEATTELIERAEAALDEPAADTEPFEGYAEVGAPDLVKAIKAGEYDLPTLFAIRDAEAAGKERSTVEEAVAEKIAAAEAALKPSDE